MGKGHDFSQPLRTFLPASVSTRDSPSWQTRDVQKSRSFHSLCMSLSACARGDAPHERGSIRCVPATRLRTVFRRPTTESAALGEDGCDVQATGTDRSASATIRSTRRQIASGSGAHPPTGRPARRRRSPHAAGPTADMISPTRGGPPGGVTVASTSARNASSTSVAGTKPGSTRWRMAKPSSSAIQRAATSWRLRPSRSS